jgi:hypothetical protein
MRCQPVFSLHKYNWRTTMRINDIIKESIQLLESVENVAVFYGGRFQPMHQGHFALYKRLVSQFGADNVFIATTFGQKQQAMHQAGDFSTDPFTFKEKAYIASKMFGIPQDHIVNTQPYRPDLSLIGRDPATTATVLAFSEKDAGRLKAGGALAPYPRDGGELESTASGRAYFLAMPIEAGGMSATDFRKAMASDAPEQEKIKTFQQFFGKFDQEIFNFIQERLTA